MDDTGMAGTADGVYATVNTVTIDFHNTLVECDAWFELEVRTLASTYLERAETRSGRRARTELLDEATRRYRALRQSVIASGQERDAVESVTTVLESLGLSTNPDEIETGVAELMCECVPEACLVPGASDLVQELHAAGTRLAVVSSAAYHPFLVWSLERFEIADCFTAIVTSAACGIYKSDPNIYRHALALLGASAERSVHIGDSQRFDVASARKAGMRTVWFDRGEEPVSDSPADLIACSLNGLSGRILELSSAERAELEYRTP